MLDRDIEILQLPGVSRDPTPDLSRYTDQTTMSWDMVDIGAGKLYDECDLGISKLGWVVLGKV